MLFLLVTAGKKLEVKVGISIWPACLALADFSLTWPACLVLSMRLLQVHLGCMKVSKKSLRVVINCTGKDIPVNARLDLKGATTLHNDTQHNDVQYNDT